MEAGHGEATFAGAFTTGASTHHRPTTKLSPQKQESSQTRAAFGLASVAGELVGHLCRRWVTRGPEALLHQSTQVHAAREISALASPPVEVCGHVGPMHATRSALVHHPQNGAGAGIAVLALAREAFGHDGRRFRCPVRFQRTLDAPLTLGAER